MKDHKLEKRHLSVYDLEGPIEDVIGQIRKHAEGLIDPRVTIDPWCDEVDLSVTGYVPLSQKEKDTAAKKRKAAREAAKRRKEKQIEEDRQELKRLAKKLGLSIADG